jgi:hypothetical protein
MLAGGREAHVVNTASVGGVIGPTFEGNRTRAGTGAALMAGFDDAASFGGE